MTKNCDECVNLCFDEETETNFCNVDLDEDEMERFLRSDAGVCPLYRRGDDYTTARKQ